MRRIRAASDNGSEYMQHATRRSAAASETASDSAPDDDDSPGASVSAYAVEAAASAFPARESRRGGRACDGCRTRKRRCDGLQPYCTNCTKSVVRDDDGNPVCTYFAEAKKRGPRPGFKDKMLLRLERLESILRPLVGAVPSIAAQNSHATAAASSAAQSASADVNGAEALDPESENAPSSIAAADPTLLDATSPLSSLNGQTSCSQSGRKRIPERRVLDLLEAVENTVNAHALTETVKLSSANILGRSSLLPAPKKLHLETKSNLTHASIQATMADPPACTEAVSADSVAFRAAVISQQADLDMPLLSIHAQGNTVASNMALPGQALQWTQSQPSAPSISISANRTNILPQKQIFHQQQPLMPPLTPQASGFPSSLSGSPPDHDFNFLFGASTNIFPASLHPSIIDPFPSIFSGQFMTTSMLNSIAMFEQANVQRSSQNDLESHLVSLGTVFNLAIPLSTQQAIDLLSPSRITSNLPRPLYETLAAMGVFFSAHPEILTSALETPVATSSALQSMAASNVARIRIARMYIVRARKTLSALVQPPGSTNLNAPDPSSASSAINSESNVPVDSLDDCDAVRIMLILAMICYGLGDGGESMQLVADAYRLAQKSLIYESSLLPSERPQRQPLTIDALVVSVPRMVGSKPPPISLTPMQRFDRRLLWGSCIILDTYCAMASGYQFGIDEGDYPHLLNGYSFDDILPHIRASTHINPLSAEKNPSQQLPRLANATLGDHTLWENSPLAIMLDDVAAMSHSTIAAATAFGATSGDASSTASIGMFEAQVRLSILMRRILRYVRLRDSVSPTQSASSSPTCDDAQTIRLHNDLLLWYASIPDRFSAFPQLEIFAHGTQQSLLDQYREWAYNLFVIEGLLTFLSAFAYLHLPLVCQGGGDRRIYRLQPASSSEQTEKCQLWSSQQILLACFRALTYVIQRLYTPTTAEQSPFIHAAYDSEKVAHCQRQPLSTDTPSPALCWTVHALNIYIVSSAALMASRGTAAPPAFAAVHDAQYEAVMRLIRTLVLPALERIGKVWPMAQLYQYKLATLLRSGTAKEWANEARLFE